MATTDLDLLDGMIREADAYHSRMRHTINAEQAAFNCLAQEFEFLQQRICSDPSASPELCRKLIDCHAQLVSVTREVSSLYDKSEMGMQQRLAAIKACDPDLFAAD